MMSEKNQIGDEDEEEKEKENLVEEFDTSGDPVITDAFASIKSAILSKRTDIVRQILCAAESIREEDYDSEDEEENDRNVIRDKYDSDEYIDMLSLLLRHKDTDSGTLLHIATRVGSADIVRTLLAAGANCLIENHEKKNPYNYCASDLVRSAYVNELMQAVSQSRIFRIDHLLKAGIDVNTCDGPNSLNSVLHWGASYGNTATVAFLIKRGADVNACNADGATPLHDAIDRKDVDIVEELLKSGADVSLQALSGPYEGKSPNELALSDPVLKEHVEAYSKGKKCNGEVNSTSPSENGDIDDSETSFITDYNGNISRRPSAVSCISSVTLAKPPSTYPVSVNIDPVVNFLCPPPQKVKQFRGLYFVPPQEMTVYIKSSQEDIMAMNDVLDLFINKFQKIGIKLTCEYLATDTKLSTKLSHMQCIINQNSFTHKEEYRIQINTHRVYIISSCLASLFYGLSTFLQCLKLFRGKAVPLLQISDWPKCNERSVLLDFNQNDIPNIDTLLGSIDLMAMFKINQIQFNVEHFIDGNDGAFYSKCESLRLQLFCKKRFISIVPYIRIGHNSPLIKSSCNNGVPELSLDVLVQKIDTFPFLRSIHVELIHSANQKIIHELCNYCNKNGYILQITSREMDIQLENIPNLMNGVVCTIDASTTNEWQDHVNSVNELGLQYVACYECTDVRRIYPDIKDFATNVYDIFSKTHMCSCYGFSLKYSFNSKRLSTFMTLLPSLIISSSMLWNLNEYVKDDVYILNVINYLIYEDDKDLIGNMLIEIGKALPIVSEKETSFDHSMYNHSLFDDLVEGHSLDISLLGSVSLQKICKTIKLMRHDLLQAKLESSLAEPFLKETSILLNLVFFLARLSYRLMSLKSKTENAELRNLPDVNKSDESNRLMAVIQDYESYCATFCKSSSQGYVTIALLQDLLQKIIPNSGQQSESPDDGIIDI